MHDYLPGVEPRSPHAISRRAWLAGSLGLGSALAGLEIGAVPATDGPRPWDKPLPLGRSGLSVTRLGFGCEGAKDADLIRRAADAGINHFNLFPDRGDLGRFPLVGRALRPVRDRVVLATGSRGRSRTDLLVDLDQQLTALGTDHIDLFYLLAVSQAETLSDELLEALRSARQAGKIRTGALSTHGFNAVLPRLRQCTDTVQALMVTCNFAAWDSGGWTEATPVIRTLREAGTGIVAMKPLMGGMGETPAGRSALAEAIRTPSGRARVMRAALRWVLQNPLVDTVPVLLASQDELSAALQAAATGLTADDEQLLAAATREAGPGLCRMCPVCQAQCRFGLPVPETLRALMYARGYRDVDRGRQAFADCQPRSMPPPCGECPGCTATCPHGVQVCQQIHQAHELWS